MEVKTPESPFFKIFCLKIDCPAEHNSLGSVAKIKYNSEINIISSTTVDAREVCVLHAYTSIYVQLMCTHVHVKNKIYLCRAAKILSLQLWADGGKRNIPSYFWRASATYASRANTEFLLGQISDYLDLPSSRPFDFYDNSNWHTQDLALHFTIRS